jgi:iron complex transport system substrate-binding protein
VKKFIALLAASILALAGCGSGVGSGSTSDRQPSRIVSLSPTVTEMLFAIGAGKQVVAVDKYSNYPADVPTDKLDGYKPSVEAISARKPDLVVLSYDFNNVVAGLKSLKIPVYLVPAVTSIDGLYAQIAELGVRTGHPTGEVIAGMKTNIDRIVAEVPKRDRKLTYYYELTPELNSVTSATFMGALLGLLGLVNIADGAQDAAKGYPKLSNETIVAANPDVIILADTKCCQASRQSVAARPGWGGLAAVQKNQVVELDDDLASRWGPRIVDLLRIIVTAVGKVT